MQFADGWSTGDRRRLATSMALPDSGVTLSPLQQQRTVAKLISARTSLSMSRQIFFVSTGGFDQHDDLVADQPGYCSATSATRSSRLPTRWRRSASRTTSRRSRTDFGYRTLTSNGDGADHAWGRRQFVVGGAVRGQQIYGQSTWCCRSRCAGRRRRALHPDDPADQYAATLASWFGVQDADLSKVAPSIGNFATRNLGFMTRGRGRARRRAPRRVPFRRCSTIAAWTLCTRRSRISLARILAGSRPAAHRRRRRPVNPRRSGSVPRPRPIGNARSLRRRRCGSSAAASRSRSRSSCDARRPR